MKWMLRKIYKWMIHRLQLKANVMVQVRDEYYFFDTYGQMWRLSPTFDPHTPITITLLERM